MFSDVISENRMLMLIYYNLGVPQKKWRKQHRIEPFFVVGLCVSIFYELEIAHKRIFTAIPHAHLGAQH